MFAAIVHSGYYRVPPPYVAPPIHGDYAVFGVTTLDGSRCQLQRQTPWLTSGWLIDGTHPDGAQDGYLSFAWGGGASAWDPGTYEVRAHCYSPSDVEAYSPYVTVTMP